MAECSPTDSEVELLALQPLRVAGHELTVFLESRPLVDSLLADIKTAQERVWVECYIFVNDSVGEAIAQALAERARAGLDVRVLYDALGSSSTPSSFFADLTAAGVQVHAFHTLWHALTRMSFAEVLNRRDHRKLLVIDDRVAYFGGMNILDQCDEEIERHEGVLRRAAGWRDVHVRLTGPQQGQLAQSFDRSWRRAHGLPVKRRPRRYRRGTVASQNESIQFFDSGPGGANTRAARIFRGLFHRAQHNITLSMAYFLPTPRVLGSLLQARKRGVRVEVILPSKSDVPMVARATRYMYPRLLRRGISIFERQERMLHSKVAVIDGVWTVVGSCNLDFRSLWYNLEFLAVIRSESLAAAMLKVCQYEMQHSHRVTKGDAHAPSAFERFLDGIAYLMRAWL